MDRNLFLAIKKEFTTIAVNIRLLKIAVIILFITNFITVGCLMGVKSIQNDMLGAKTMNAEIKQVWELEPVPTEDLMKGVK